MNNIFGNKCEGHMQNTRNLKQSRKNRLMLVEATKIDLINHALQLLPKVEGILLPFSKIIRDSYKKRNEKSKKKLSKVFPRISPKIKQKWQKLSPRLTSNLNHTNPVTKNIFKPRLKAAFTRQTNHFLSKLSKNDQRERNRANIKGSKSSFW